MPWRSDGRAGSDGSRDRLRERDLETLERGLNFTLRTALGDLDLLGEVAGGGRYEHLVGRSVLLKVFDSDVRVVTLGQIICLKRAAGHPKDLEALAELEVLAEEGRRGAR